MHRTPIVLAVAFLSVLAGVRAAEAQRTQEGWTDRPDARPPAGLEADVLLAPGAYELRYGFSLHRHERFQVATDEIPAVLVLQDWAMAPSSLTVQRHVLEGRAGLLEWLGASVLLPIRHARAAFFTEEGASTEATSFGLGDLEGHLLVGLHDAWPYRAHVSAGISIPTGSVSERGRLPDAPGTRTTLPYPMQPGDGTFALLPAAVFTAENESATVGFRADGRVPVGENSRGWTRGTTARAHVWAGYRFTDWIGGTARVTFTRTGAMEGTDPRVDPWSSPMAHPALQGGTRVEIPVGMNVRFAEGRLEGNRLHLEFTMPVHQNLDGPQLRTRPAAVLSWTVRP